MSTNKAHSLAQTQLESLVQTLHSRFENNPHRHAGLKWQAVRTRLENHPAHLRSLYEMERTGGEPDVIGRDAESGRFLFCDCSAESPAQRRSLCYDQDALASRKDHPPRGSALEMAAAMGIELLTESLYLTLQSLGTFDTKTSSWVLTPPDVRNLGGALFGDRRYDRAFIYHNGAQSYYAARGFRGVVRV